MTLSESIKIGMKKAGIGSYAELSKLSGVPIDTIKTYTSQKGKQHNPSIGFLRKISAVIDLSDFLNIVTLPTMGEVVPKLSLSGVPKSAKNVSYLSLSGKKSVPKTQNSPQTLKANSYYTIPKLNLTAQAGGGNEVLDLECYESGEVLTIDKAFFKAVPGNKLKAIRVEGYSMIPMLMPDSWVVFEDNRNYKGDGLYIINYAGQLMVKLLQLDPAQKILDIISVNKEYKSYSVALAESQAEVIIVGKVLRCII